MTSPAGGSSPLAIESLLAAAFTPQPEPPAPTKITLKALREAIARTLSGMSANDVAEDCVRFGMEPSRDDADDPWHGEERYVLRRVRDYALHDLVILARSVNEQRAQKSRSLAQR